jgi:hypothetical protein
MDEVGRIYESADRKMLLRWILLAFAHLYCDLFRHWGWKKIKGFDNTCIIGYIWMPWSSLSDCELEAHQNSTPHYECQYKLQFLLPLLMSY